jgi:HD-GYP domain-containing protein (c-di-GMP phosphodiesterase class II)
MTHTQALLGRIAALRERMEQAHAKGSAATAKEGDAGTPAANRVDNLESLLVAGTRYGKLLDRSFHQLEEAVSSNAIEPVALPRQLTARARRLLLLGQELLGKLRAMADQFGSEPNASGLDSVREFGSWPGIDSVDPLAARYRETIAMLDTALRTVQAYPDSPSVQLRLCDGLEAVLAVVSEHSGVLQGLVEQRKSEVLRIDRLAEVLVNMAANKPVDVASLYSLAETMLAELGQGSSLRFLQVEPLADPRCAHAQRWLARAVACHSLTVAQVVARLVRHEPDLRQQPVEPVLAALLHDVGMLRVPVEVYAQREPLDEQQRRLLEGHTRIGAELVARLMPAAGWLTEAAASHHERADGTGYPAGLREMQIAPLVRFLAVCDVFAAWCTARPHRPAREPRTAMTDTLLLADKGILDRNYAERLLLLSFYPVGSIVELADGAMGVVVATPVDRRDLNSPARPVVLLLTESHGQWLPTPRHVNLAESEGRTIVRSLMPAERRRLLGKRYPEWV